MNGDKNVIVSDEHNPVDCQQQSFQTLVVDELKIDSENLPPMSENVTDFAISELQNIDDFNKNSNVNITEVNISTLPLKDSNLKEFKEIATCENEITNCGTHSEEKNDNDSLDDCTEIMVICEILFCENKLSFIVYNLILFFFLESTSK